MVMRFFARSVFSNSVFVYYFTVLLVNLLQVSRSALLAAVLTMFIIKQCSKSVFPQVRHVSFLTVF